MRRKDIITHRVLAGIGVVLAIGVTPLLLNLLAGALSSHGAPANNVGWVWLLGAVVVAVTIQIISTRPTAGLRGSDDSEFRRNLLNAVRRIGIDPAREPLRGREVQDLQLTAGLQLVGTLGEISSERKWAERTTLGALVDRLPTRVLILGAPGFGKTIALATLCDRMHTSAEKSNEAPIPVLLGLSTWGRRSIDGGSSSFLEWVSSEIARVYLVGNVSRLRSMLSTGGIALVLDALDEVTEDRRFECLTRLNEFLRTESRSISVIVSARTSDYEMLTHSAQPLDRLLIGAAYKIEPVGWSAAETSLRRAWPPKVLAAATTNDALRAAVEAPLFLGLARESPKPEYIVTLRNKRAIERTLLSELVDRAVQSPSRPSGWTPDYAMQVLRGLARFMSTSAVDRTTFLPEDVIRSAPGRRSVQPRWPPVAAWGLTLAYLLSATLMTALLHVVAGLGAGPVPPAGRVAVALARALVPAAGFFVVALWIPSWITDPRLADASGPRGPTARYRRWKNAERRNAAAWWGISAGVIAGLGSSPAIISFILCAGASVAGRWLAGRGASVRELWIEEARDRLEWYPDDIDAFVRWGAAAGLLRPATGRSLSFRHRELRELLAGVA